MIWEWFEFSQCSIVVFIMWSLKKTNTRMRTIITSCCPRGTAVIPPFPLESYLILACPLKDVLSDPLPAPYTHHGASAIVAVIGSEMFKMRRLTTDNIWKALNPLWRLMFRERVRRRLIWRFGVWKAGKKGVEKRSERRQQDCGAFSYQSGSGSHRSLGWEISKIEETDIIFFH